MRVGCLIVDFRPPNKAHLIRSSFAANVRIINLTEGAKHPALVLAVLYCSVNVQCPKLLTKTVRVGDS